MTISLRARIDSLARCPWCSDAVEARDAVACERERCALYHPECWQECQAQHGSCAILGCGGTAAARLTRIGFWRSLARLFAHARGEVSAELAESERERRAHRERWREAGQPVFGTGEAPPRLSGGELLVFCGCFFAMAGSLVGIWHAGWTSAWFRVLLPAAAACLGGALALALLTLLTLARLVARGELRAVERQLDPTVPEPLRRVRPRRAEPSQPSGSSPK